MVNSSTFNQAALEFGPLPADAAARSITGAFSVINETYIHADQH
jgi:hypothetical protein